MEDSYITIAKKPGIKDCVRISSAEDVPEFLKDVVIVSRRNKIILDCLEGIEIVPLGSVIAYEKLESGEMNAWIKANWKETTREIDGVFYEIPKPVKAVRVTDELPQSVIEGLGDRFKELPDGSFQIDAGWGLVTCAPYNGYLVIYGTKEDGTLDANFLTKGTPSFEQYYLVDENGELGQTLSEYDAKQMEQDSKSKTI